MKPSSATISAQISRNVCRDRESDGSEAFKVGPSLSVACYCRPYSFLSQNALDRAAADRHTGRVHSPPASAPSDAHGVRTTSRTWLRTSDFPVSQRIFPRWPLRPGGGVRYPTKSRIQRAFHGLFMVIPLSVWHFGPGIFRRSPFARRAAADRRWVLSPKRTRVTERHAKLLSDTSHYGHRWLISFLISKHNPNRLFCRQQWPTSFHRAWGCECGGVS